MNKKDSYMQAIMKTDVKTTKIPDGIVVERILNGEKELFEILMRRYNQTLYRVVRGYLKAEDAIEDVMQEAYLKAFWKLNQFKNDAAFSTWLIRIGINEALQYIRKQSTVQSVSNFKYENDLLSAKFNSMNPEKRTIQNETRVLIEKAVDKLPENYRIVYIMREVEGMNNKAIAKCLGLSESNIKVRFHRSKEMLKEMLYDFSDGVELFEFGDSRCDNLVNQVMQKI